MMDDGPQVPPTSSWDEVLAKAGALVPAPDPEPPAAESVVPEVHFDFSDDPLDGFLGQFDILEYYRRFCRKMEPYVAAGQTESIMISCPNPAHPDKNPSAWIALNKGDGGVWYCGGCGMGGDKHDIAAWHFGYDVPSYREMGTPFFHNVKVEAAADFGYTPEDPVDQMRFLEELQETQIAVYQDQPPIPASTAIPGPPTEVPLPVEVATEQPPTPTPTATVTPIHAVPTPDESVEGQQRSWYEQGDAFDWVETYDPDGFRYAYMDESAPTRIIPHEFFAAGADMLLGLATGHHVCLRTTANVYGNFFQSLVGPTGSGKSLSMIPANMLAEEVLPFNEFNAQGAKRLHSPGSGEALIDMMGHMGVDPATSQPVQLPVVGYMYIDELAQLIMKTQRKGSTLQSILIEMFGSADSRMSTKSMTGGLYACHRPYLTLVTGTQPAAMRSLLDDVMLVNGFLNRFMFYVATQPALPKNYDDTQDNPFRMNLSKQRLEGIRDWAVAKPDHYKLEWHDDARAAYMDAFTQEGWSTSNYDAVPVLARSRLIFLKLILLAAADVRSDMVLFDHVDRAFMQLQYMKTSLLYVAHHIGMTTYDECMEKILAIIKRIDKGEGVKKGDIRRNLPSTFHEQMDKTLEFMVDMRYLELEVPERKGTKGGRPTVKYKLAS